MFHLSFHNNARVEYEISKEPFPRESSRGLYPQAKEVYWCLDKLKVWWDSLIGFSLKGYVTVLSLFSRQNFTKTITYCLYLWVIHFFEYEKKICDKFLRKDLSKVGSGPKTQSVQSQNLKKLGNFVKL